MVEQGKTPYNSTPKGGVSCSKDSFVVAECVVLRTGFCAENPAHIKSTKRSGLPFLGKGTIRVLF